MTYPHCSVCDCDLFELQEVEAEMCTECQEELEEVQSANEI